eukprot:CAMPEP_0184497058 /NCGR_PEP_ID=MMETSP0113_2-20130426/35591_1 /TAXON_ID=91329 /ORGANISM="Norrisiella sphaerica, Strain BC52" /LENGTH=570 /DNA_ID=CAMNT_0026884003 /DNA_START=222 /DNA_END=1934 /DNA_ORIENTATION=+
MRNLEIQPYLHPISRHLQETPADTKSAEGKAFPPDQTPPPKSAPNTTAFPASPHLALTSTNGSEIESTCNDNDSDSSFHNTQHTFSARGQKQEAKTALLKAPEPSSIRSSPSSAPSPLIAASPDTEFGTGKEKTHDKAITATSEEVSRLLSGSSGGEGRKLGPYINDSNDRNSSDDMNRTTDKNKNANIINNSSRTSPSAASDDTSKHASSSTLYDLMAVVKHHGKSTGSGHYTTFTKSDQDSWVHYDDTFASLITDSQVSDTEPYMLFYKRRGSRESSSESDHSCSKSAASIHTPPPSPASRSSPVPNAAYPSAQSPLRPFDTAAKGPPPLGESIESEPGDLKQEERRARDNESDSPLPGPYRPAAAKKGRSEAEEGACEEGKEREKALGDVQRRGQGETQDKRLGQMEPLPFRERQLGSASHGSPRNGSINSISPSNANPNPKFPFPSNVPLSQPPPASDREGKESKARPAESTVSEPITSEPSLPCRLSRHNSRSRASPSPPSPRLERVALWDTRKERKLDGLAAPRAEHVLAYLRQNRHLQIYNRQDLNSNGSGGNGGEGDGRGEV